MSPAASRESFTWVMRWAGSQIIRMEDASRPAGLAGLPVVSSTTWDNGQ
jgi:hypothetical protein